MIPAIQTVLQKNNIPKSENKTNMKTQQKVNDVGLRQDVFQKNQPSFKGIKLPSGEYSIEEVRYAKKVVEKVGDAWKKELYKREYNRHKHSHGVIVAEGQNKFAKFTDRLIVDTMTLGLGEIFYQTRNVVDSQKAKNTVSRMSKVVSDVRHIKYKEDTAALEKAELSALRRLEYQKKLIEIKEERIQPEILDTIQRQREGRYVDLPNNIMFANKDEKINEELINWTIENANANVKTVDAKKVELLDVLDEAEEHFQETGDWNLIHVKNMDSLLNKESADESVIESMKDIMSATAEDYHTTILFSAAHPEKLDSIALQPHRVRQIDVTDITSPINMDIKDAISRVHDEKNIKETPLSVVNDLLLIANKDDKYKMDWQNTFSKSIYNDVRNNLKQKFLQEDHPNGVEYMNILGRATKNLI